MFCIRRDHKVIRLESSMIESIECKGRKGEPHNINCLHINWVYLFLLETQFRELNQMDAVDISKPISGIPQYGLKSTPRAVAPERGLSKVLRVLAHLAA